MRLRGNRHFLTGLALAAFVTACVAQSTSQAVRDHTLASAALKRDVPYRVILPAGYDAGTTRYPVLYLLHGHGGNFANWTAATKLVDHARPYPIIIVTPEGANSWYVDGGNEEKWERYLTTDLVAEIDTKFRTVATREGRVIAGLSMGGYGAIKAGLKRADLFSLVGSFSGALDITRPNDVFRGERDPEVMSIFGPIGSTVRKTNDVYALTAAADPAKVPYFWLTCGTSDPWLEPNREMARAMKSRGIAHEYRETPGGHTWIFWDRAVSEFLKLAVAKRSGAN